jgi:hypothetical protein
MKKRRGGVECQTALSNVRGDAVTGFISVSDERVSQCGHSEMRIRALKRDRGREYPGCETNAMTRRE